MINIYDDVNNLVSNLKKHELTVNFKEIRKKLKEEKERDYHIKLFILKNLLTGAVRPIVKHY